MKIFKIKTKLKISYVIILIIFLIISFRYPERKYLKIYDRRSEVVFLMEEVKEGDMLRLEIEHSFEHIPWFEYYRVTDDYFLLKKIAVAGYGAGIPAEMDVPTKIEDGLVWMEDIDSRFDELKWLTHNVYMKTLTLNNKVIFDFRSLPNASLVGAVIEKKRGVWNCLKN